MVFSRPGARRLAHPAEHPRVALNLDSDGRGGDMIIVAGTAAHAPDVPPADRGS